MNTQVEVKSNSLRAEGMIAIAEALKLNKTVTNIDLSSNEIAGWTQNDRSTDYEDVFHPTPEGPAALAEALKVNTSITSVRKRRLRFSRPRI